MWLRLHRLSLIAIVGLFLTACAGAPQSKMIRQSYLETSSSNLLNSSSLLSGVPFIAQEEYQCGPAAIAMLLQYSGVDVSADEMVNDVYLPARNGSLQPEMLAAPRRFDRMSVVLPPSLEAVLTEVQSGSPVLVMQNLGLAQIPQWHYAVVIGFDLNAQEIILHSGTIAQYRMSMKTFERTWQRVDHWAFVLIKPGEIPVSVSDGVYMEALSAFERVASPVAVSQAYVAGLDRWPDNELLGIGIANQHYEAGKINEAVLAYQRVLRVHPRSAATHNNLAQSLFSLGEHDEALRHAQIAVSLGGNFAQVYADTLSEIEASLSKD